ncbi:MAG TPA: MarR family transcriptional regulator [Mycobacteriales bacterium]|nr:MarR family transcriptional regulator [Mycobacteriales bacterium]
MDKSRRDLSTSAWGALLQVHAALVPVLDKRLQLETGLALSWYDVLLELSAAPERRLRMSDLGERVVLSRTRVSRLVEDLVAAGLVSREVNPADARSAYAVLTPQGLARFRQAAPVYLRGIDEHFAEQLSDSELRTIARALGRVLDANSA